MGELDEKETPPSSEPQHETEEPKETDKMLEKKDDTTTTTTTNTTTSDNKTSPKSKPPTGKSDTETKKASTPTTKSDKEDEKKKEANGEEIINIPESAESTQAAPVTQEGREVKPKKIPIGGIKMPGFFTRGKPPRGEGDGAEGELLEKEGNDNKLNEENPKDDEKRPSIAERIRSFFTRKPPAKVDDDIKDIKSGGE